MSQSTFPPTVTPEKEHGPWCSTSFDRWWVVADGPAEAVAHLQSVDAEIFPSYFGWRAIVEPVLIRWANSEEHNDECEIVECMSNDDGAVEGFRISLENR